MHKDVPNWRAASGECGCPKLDSFSGRLGRQPWKHTVIVAPERANRNYGRHLQTSVDVGKQLASAFEILMHHSAVQPRRVDFQKHEILPPLENTVCYSGNLMGVRAVDKAFSAKRRRLV